MGSERAIPLPQFHEPPESPNSRPELAEEYPFILITGGRHQPYYHPEYRQVKSMPPRDLEIQHQRIDG